MTRVPKETQEEIYRLRQVEGLTTREVAKRLKVGRGTIQTFGGPPRKDVQFPERGKPIEDVIQELKDRGKSISGSDKELRRRLIRIRNEEKNAERNKANRQKHKKSEAGKQKAKEYSQTPKARAARSEQKKAKTAARQEEKKILQSKNPVIITDPEEIRKLAQEKANNAIKFAKERSTYYKIDAADDSSSWITGSQLKKLKNKGKNPTIYGTRIAGDFSKEARAEMRKTIERQASEYLSKGGDARNIPELGHYIALSAVDEDGQRIASGLTNPHNISLQDPDINRNLGATVDKEILQASEKKGSIPKRLLKARGFLPSLLSVASLPLLFASPERAQAMTNAGEQAISDTASSFLPTGLIDYAKKINDKVDIGLAAEMPLNTLGGMQATIGQQLLAGVKQAPADTIGLALAAKDWYNSPNRKKEADEMNLFNMVYSP